MSNTNQSPLPSLSPVGTSQTSPTQLQYLPQQHPQQMSPQGKPKGLNLFVANLSQDVDDGLFQATFEAIGPVLSAKVMLDIHTGLSRRFGFVLFEKEEDGARALQELQGRPLGAKGNPMVISKAQTSGYNAVQPTTKIHVRNVPRSVSNNEIRQLLLQYGKLERLAIRGEITEAAAGTYGVFVQYSTSQEANEAVRMIHNTKPWPDMHIPLLAKPAETAEMRAERRARQEQQRRGPPQQGTGVAGQGVPPQTIAHPPTVRNGATFRAAVHSVPADAATACSCAPPLSNCPPIVRRSPIK